jgi:hypothetical protein
MESSTKNCPYGNEEILLLLLGPALWGLIAYALFETFGA